MRKSTFRKNYSVGNSINMGGGMNDFAPTNTGIPRKPIMQMRPPSVKTPSPMGAPMNRPITPKPMGGSLNRFNPYARSGSMATGMGNATMRGGFMKNRRGR
jgi:hypothetical protein